MQILAFVVFGAAVICLHAESIFYELEALVSASFVFVQGMLAGLGLVLLLIGFGNSTTQTLAAISSISVQLERATFFLALTSAAGSIHKLCVDNACCFHGSRSLVYYDALIVCLYVTCVIFTILAAPVDEIMFHSSLRVPDWCPSVLLQLACLWAVTSASRYLSPLPSAFLAAFDNWKRYVHCLTASRKARDAACRFNGVRASTAIAGWLVLSFHTRSYSSTLPRGNDNDRSLYEEPSAM